MIKYGLHGTKVSFATWKCVGKYIWSGWWSFAAFIWNHAQVYNSNQLIYILESICCGNVPIHKDILLLPFALKKIAIALKSLKGRGINGVEQDKLFITIDFIGKNLSPTTIRDGAKIKYISGGNPCRSKLHDDESSMSQVVLMMTKSPKEWLQEWVNKFKIKIDFKIQEKMNSRFKRRNQEDFTREVLKKIFQKIKHSTVLFYKRVLSKFSKLPEYLLSGNRLPVSCNRLPVIKFDFKNF